MKFNAIALAVGAYCGGIHRPRTAHYSGMTFMVAGGRIASLDKVWLQAS